MLLSVESSGIKDGERVDDKSDRLNGLLWFVSGGITPPAISSLSPRGNEKSSGAVVVMVTGALDPQGLMQIMQQNLYFTRTIIIWFLYINS